MDELPGLRGPVRSRRALLLAGILLLLCPPEAGSAPATEGKRASGIARTNGRTLSRDPPAEVARLCGVECTRTRRRHAVVALYCRALSGVGGRGRADRVALYVLRHSQASLSLIDGARDEAARRRVVVALAQTRRHDGPELPISGTRSCGRRSWERLDGRRDAAQPNRRVGFEASLLSPVPGATASQPASRRGHRPIAPVVVREPAFEGRSARWDERQGTRGFSALRERENPQLLRGRPRRDVRNSRIFSHPWTRGGCRQRPATRRTIERPGPRLRPVAETTMGPSGLAEEVWQQVEVPAVRRAVAPGRGAISGSEGNVPLIIVPYISGRRAERADSSTSGRKTRTVLGLVGHMSVPEERQGLRVASAEQPHVVR